MISTDERKARRTLDEFLWEEACNRMQFAPPSGYNFYAVAPEILVHTYSANSDAQTPQDSDIRLLATALQPIPIWDATASSDDFKLLYHYTHKDAFAAISASRTIYATLKEFNKNTRDTCFGDGVYTTSRAPHDFTSKRAVLINNFSNAAEPERQYEHIQKHKGCADYCIPLFVPHGNASDIHRRATPEMPGPGIDVHGKAVNKTRDIWVVTLHDDDGTMLPAKEPREVGTSRVEEMKALLLAHSSSARPVQQGRADWGSSGCCFEFVLARFRGMMGSFPALPPPIYIQEDGLISHRHSGIKIPLQPLTWHQKGSSDSTAEEEIVLYHYCSEDTFLDLTNSHRISLASFKLRDSYSQRAHFGDGVYATRKAPHEFGTKYAILKNNYTNKSDTEDIRFSDALQPFRHFADYCIPILVPRGLAVNVLTDKTREMQRPGYDSLLGENMRSDRDIWVIPINDKEEIFVGPDSYSVEKGERQGRSRMMRKEREYEQHEEQEESTEREDHIKNQHEGKEATERDNDEDEDPEMPKFILAADIDFERDEEEAGREAGSLFPEEDEDKEEELN